MCLFHTGFPTINYKLPDSPTTRCGWWSVAAGRRWWGRRLLRLSLLRTPASRPWSGLRSARPLLPVAASKAQAARSPGTRNIPEPACAAMAAAARMDGWPLLHARSSAQSRLVWFLFWINSSGVLDRSAGGSCGRISLYGDAASSDFNAQAGGGHENALLRSRLSRSAWGGHTHALGNNARAVMHFTRKRDWNRFHKKIVALCLMSNVSWRKNTCRRINNGDICDDKDANCLFPNLERNKCRPLVLLPRFSFLIFLFSLLMNFLPAFGRTAPLVC